MPKRNSINREQPSTSLRRSPRFLHNKVNDPEEPKTPKSKSSRTRIATSCTPFSSNRKVSVQKIHNSCPDEGLKKVNELNIKRKGSVRPNLGSRRSARLIGRVEEFSYVELSPTDNVEKRVTRSSTRGKPNPDVLQTGDGNLEKATRSFCRGTTNRYVKKVGYDEPNEVLGKEGLLDEHKTSSVHGGGNSGKNTQKSSNPICDGFNEFFSDDVLHGGVPPHTEKSVSGVGLSMLHSSEASQTVIEGVGKRDGGNVDKGRKQVGAKRRRNHAEKGNGIVHGWTKDQELALERAYFAAKPTPQFWKKVARLVPGKSAQDCFDKVHSNHLTPPQPQPRSRAKALSSPPASLSASKLLNSSGPKVKRPMHSKKSCRLVQKTVRHLLQKQCQGDQDSEADLFSVLEHRMSPSAQSIQQDAIITTPNRNQKKSELLKRCKERSSSAHKKSLSRFSGSSGTTLVSPPVLKQVKNKALHEKYIDLLHCREANRKVAFARTSKSHQGKAVIKESCDQKRDAIKAAKSALVFDASDAIKQFQHSQANGMMTSYSHDDDVADNDEDEGEEIF